MLRKTIFVRKKNTYQSLSIEEILFIQADGDYILIHTKNDKHLITKALVHFLKVLPDSAFIRVHRTYAVNVNKIDKIESKTIHINEYKIPIGKTYLKQVKSEILLFKELKNEQAENNL